MRLARERQAGSGNIAGVCEHDITFEPAMALAMYPPEPVCPSVGRDCATSFCT